MSILQRFESGTAKVLVVGGCPFSGKTTVARLIARRLGVELISTDDLASAARAVTSKMSHPALHLSDGFDYREYYVQHSVEQLWDHAEREHSALRPAILAVIEAHAQWSSRVVVEGWAIRPEWMKTPDLESVVSVFIGAPRSVLVDRVTADVAFYRGASNERRMIENYVGRSERHQEFVRAQCARLTLAYVEGTGDQSAELIADRILSLEQSTGRHVDTVPSEWR